MKHLVIGLVAVTLLASCGPKSDEVTSDSSSQEIEVSSFDSSLALELGADAYGMKSYVMAFLKKGPNRETDPAKAAELQTAHLANITRLAEAGKLVLAGPFMGDGEIRGIYVFDVATVEEAQELTKTDSRNSIRQPGHGTAPLVRQRGTWQGE